MLALINLIPRPLLLAGVVALLALSGKLGWDNAALKVDLAEVKEAHAQELALQSSAYASAQAEARAAEQALQLALNDNVRLKNEQLESVRRVAADIRDRLRQPSKQPASPGQSGGPKLARIDTFASGSLGAELRTTAEPLVGEAERADTIRLELLSCYAAYEGARSLTRKP